MFDENFSFDGPRSPSVDSSNSPSTRDASRSVSPCSAVGPYPPPRFSVTDLAAQFADQRIQRMSRICYDSCEAYANLDDDEAGWSIEDDAFAPIQRSRTYPQRPARLHSSTQRLERQVNARLLCSSTHHRDIAALVARMVESNDQCSISPPNAIAEEDEGYNSSDGSTPAPSRRSSLAPSKQRFHPRRSSDMKSTGACVSKNARLRKDRPQQHVRTRSSEKPTR